MATKPKPFYGREYEQEQLESYLAKPTSSLIVIHGRRRVGKSRLIDEFSQSFKTVYKFSGIAPTLETTAATQRKNFTTQLTRVMGIPPVQSDNWGDLFWFMSKEINQSQTIIILDEITWMGDLDAEFLPQLQHIWETHLKDHPKLVMIICGSVSSWIEENILNNTAFVGRISLDMRLKELPIETCKQFWRDKKGYIASREIFKVLSITGGIPWYLEHINPKLSAEDNIRSMAFTQGEVLYRDFERIFTDVFGKRNELYINIVTHLLKKSVSQLELSEKLGVEKSGKIGEYLANLINSGFIQRDYTWKLESGKQAKHSIYRLSDNYVRFYLKYIAPNKEKINRGNMRNISLNSLSHWDTIMGLQFENLILNNRHLIQQQLNVKPEDIIYDNPYFQTHTQRQKACQFDYVIQTRNNTLYIIEIKFSKNTIKSSVIDEMIEKISRLKIPKTYTIRPVLIYVNGLEKPLEESDYFVKMIDFAQLIESL